MGACGGANGIAVPASGVEVTFAKGEFRLQVKVPGVDGTVAITVKVCPSNVCPAALVNPEMATLVPGVKVFTAVNVTALELIEKEVNAATELHDVPTQAAKGAEMSVT